MILTVTLNASIDKRYIVDEFIEGRVNRVRECSYTPGGKGLNVSKPASIAGSKVVATGFVGGHAGAYIEEGLSEFNIVSAFYHVKGESRSCINIWDEKNQRETEFLEPGFTLEREDYEKFLDKFRALVKDAEVVAMSGSAPKGIDGGEAYKTLVGICKEAGKSVIMDTSGQALLTGIEALPTMIKPNTDEISMLTGSDCSNFEDKLAAAKKVHDKGVKIVVCSMGIDGSFVVCDEGVFRAKVPRNKPVNTVGCGDSMVAGFAVGLERGLPMEETLRLASAISGAAALREETGFYVKEDMEKIYGQVEISRL
ncbi:MAG: 1-phosphofructokinase [Lachnospiraceae bacterium]|nr:1-phosphofructokinase [Lachnospiraceae bacterium]